MIIAMTTLSENNSPKTEKDVKNQRPGQMSRIYLG